MTLIIFALAVYGIANTIIFANGPFHIFRKMHVYLADKHPMLDEMTTCFICLPWWIGMTISTANLILFPYCDTTPMMNLIGEGGAWYAVIFLDGAIASACSWLIHTMQEALERTNQS